MAVAPNRNRCSAVSALVYFGALYVAVNAWSAIDIFVFGHFDSKFGGPVDNLMLVLRFTALGLPFCALGCYLAVLLLQFRREMASWRRCSWTGVAAAGATLALLGAGLFPWFTKVVPTHNTAIEFSLTLILIGLVAGAAAGGLVAFLDQRRQRRRRRIEGQDGGQEGA